MDFFWLRKMHWGVLWLSFYHWLMAKLDTNIYMQQALLTDNKAIKDVAVLHT